MQNLDLARDYIKRAEIRIGAIEYLFQKESWPDVVRESQETVELALKALLRSHGIEVPRVHDVSKVIEENSARLPKSLDLEKLSEISKELRRDREIAFYGSEDLTPSEFYSKKDGKKALDYAQYVVNAVKQFI
ncbi:MAG: HEPN domain-containing protein [Oligoflexales bacterium]|nr:HEPN domain-containing protein [Oligoflexales bacterium]